MQKEFETVIMRFLEEAGKIAMDYQENIDNSKSYLKDSGIYSIVTEADEKLSNLFEKTLQDNLKGVNYLIIDEEKIKNLGENKFKTIDESEYQFVIDPIDGTLTYSLSMPLFGISVGVLKNKKPYMGFIYCPYMKELVYNNGEETYWIKQAFSSKEKKEVLVKNNTSKVIFDSSFSRRFANTKFRKVDGYVFMNFYSAVVHFLYILTNRAKGHYFNLALWDIAGAWAPLNALGYHYFNAETGEALVDVSEKNFDEELSLKGPYVVCADENFENLRSLVEEEF